MQRVLVTGATGFIGKHTLPLLLSKGFEVHAVSSNSIQADNNNYSWHQADLLNLNQTKDLLAQVSPTHLLHFAWYTEPKQYWTSHNNLQWLQSSLSLLEAFEYNGGKRAVFAGTCAEYEWKFSKYIENKTPLNPTTLYGICKHSLQTILGAYSRETQLSSAWGRIFFLFGPEEHPDRLVSSVISSLLKGDTAPCSKGNQLRDFLYVEDVASAFVSILESDVEGPINIGSGKAVTVKDLVRKISKKLKKCDLISFGDLPTSPDDPKKLVADITKLTKVVGWTQKYDLDAGIQKTITWWEKQFPNNPSARLINKNSTEY